MVTEIARQHPFLKQMKKKEKKIKVMARAQSESLAYMKTGLKDAHLSFFTFTSR